jgi:NitT/TauT family transport system substrate-binding protein
MLTKINIFPTGMRLHEWIAFEEGLFRDEGLEPEVMWDVYLGQMKAWTGGYGDRPQDRPFLDGVQAIGNACAWGSVCNAGAGMGRFVPDAYGIARHAIFVRPDSSIRCPEDLGGVPIAVGLMAGSHYNVPYRLEQYLPMDRITIAPVGGFGRRLQALLEGEVEAASLLDPQIYMAEELGLRKILGGDFNTLWWVDERSDPDVLRRYFRALEGAERALDAHLARYLPLWRHCIPPELAGRSWNVDGWGPGERFVFGRFPAEKYADVVTAIQRWGWGRT